MATFDFAQGAINLKVVYYGCALGGKTTNLVTLHSLTDPDGKQGLVSIATKDDRTLFFDLLPLDMGQVAGLKIRVKVYTVPGQVHYETTRRQVLNASDGVVMVIDSSPAMQQGNSWALENLQHNLKLNRLDPETTPVVLQWNKRDLPDAVSVAQLEASFNPEKRCSHESVATTGAGVIETFESVVKQAVQAACAKAGRKPLPEEALDKTLQTALAEARSRSPGLPEEGDATFDRRFDMDAYKEDWANKGRDRNIVDEKTLLSEAVQTGMELAEKLENMGSVQSENQGLGRMLVELGKAGALLSDCSGPALPPGTMQSLLASCGRSRGSLLLFHPGETTMDEREVVPPGSADPLNGVVAPSIGSAAYRVCQGDTPRVVEDLSSEVFFDAVPTGADGLASALVAPMVCDDLRFGALLVYATRDEDPFGTAERGFWAAAASWIGLSLHWRGLRRKLARPASAPAGN